MHYKARLIAMSFFTIIAYNATAQPTNNRVTIVGEMRNVMWKGQLHGNIQLDTIADRKHLYGLGPQAYLSGEILIMDGMAYQSKVVSEKAMKVDTTYSQQSPFFAYGNVEEWKAHPLPENVKTLPQLEQYLDAQTASLPRPFFFLLKGTVEHADIHIVNLPSGAKVSSPDDAHQGQVNYRLANEQVEMLGFFSTRHKAIFTHHDTYLHVHLISADRKKMGHLDEVRFQKGSMQLYLPAAE